MLWDSEDSRNGKPILPCYYLDCIVYSYRTKVNIYIFTNSTTKVLAMLFAVHSKVTTQVQLDYVITAFLFRDLQFRCSLGLDLEITPNRTQTAPDPKEVHSSA
jgi:hypothetical protein